VTEAFARADGIGETPLKHSLQIFDELENPIGGETARMAPLTDIIFPILLRRSRGGAQEKAREEGLSNRVYTGDTILNNLHLLLRNIRADLEDLLRGRRP